MAGNTGKVRIGIIGTGEIAGAHLEGYRILRVAGYNEFEITALCDNSPERRDAFAHAAKEKLGIEPPHYSSAEEMVAAGVVDAADICTPHAFHHTTAIPCLEAGIDVMVEKPCGITIKATDLILAAAEKAGRLVAVAEQVRRGIRARAMRWALIEKGMIGNPEFFLVEGFSFNDYSQAAKHYAMQWRLLKLLTGGGMIFDAGAHFADMVLHLFGDVEEINCRTKTLQSVIIPSPELGPTPLDVEDTWMSTLRFRSGLLGQWSWSFSAYGEGVAAQILYGSLGSARDRGGWMHPFQTGGDITFADGSKKPYEAIEAEFRAALDPETRERYFPHGVENDMALECWDFVDAVQKRRKPEIDGVDGKRAKSICLAMYESATAKAPVSPADVFSGKVHAYQDPIDEYWGI
jgi:predicted dehydrogenase